MSSSNCCFLTCIQISQEAGQVALVFPSLSEFSTVYCDPHSQRLWNNNTVNPLHAYPQVSNSHRCEQASLDCFSRVSVEWSPASHGSLRHYQARVKLQQRSASYRNDPPASPCSRRYLFLPVRSVPAAILLTFFMYCSVRTKMFSVFFVCFFLYYLLEKYYKPTRVQDYIVNCVSFYLG